MRHRIRKVGAAFVTAALAWSCGAGTAVAQPGVQRLAGQNRYATMAAIVNEGFSTSEWAVVATGDNFPDALTASSLAGALRCPIVLTSSSLLCDEAATELANLGVQSVYIVGGYSSVSYEVEAAIEAMGISTARAWGPDRIGTGIDVWNALRGTGATTDTVIIATGASFADSLSIGPWAYYANAPILLTQGGVLTDEEVAAIQADPSIAHVVIVGGSASVSDAVMTQLGDGYDYTRLSGANRVETSARVAEWESERGFRWTFPALATALNFPDALCGTALQGVVRSPLLLVSGDSAAVSQAVADHSAEVSALRVLGGESSVSDQVVAQVLGGPTTPIDADQPRKVEVSYLWQARGNADVSHGEQNLRFLIGAGLDTGTAIGRAVSDFDGDGTAETLVVRWGDMSVNLEIVAGSGDVVGRATVTGEDSDWPINNQGTLDILIDGSGHVLANVYTGPRGIANGAFWTLVRYDFTGSSLVEAGRAYLAGSYVEDTSSLKAEVGALGLPADNMPDFYPGSDEQWIYSSMQPGFSIVTRLLATSEDFAVTGSGGDYMRSVWNSGSSTWCDPQPMGTLTITQPSGIG